MNATPRPSSFVSSQFAPSQGKHRSERLEKSYRNCMTPHEAELDWFAGLMWKAFPEAKSENELSELVAEVLTTERRPVHPKTVRNWLRKLNAPHFRYVIRVIALVGAESVFQIIDVDDAA